ERFLAVRRLQRRLQGLMLELGNGGALVHLDRHGFPRGGHHDAHRKALERGGRHATSTSDASGRGGKNRPIAWAENSGGDGTRATPFSLSSHTLITSSSPPCPRRLRKRGPSFSTNAELAGTRSAKNSLARARTSAGGSVTVVVWIMVPKDSALSSRLRSLGPVLVGTRRRRLIGMQAVGANVGVDEILGRHGRIREPAQHGELADMRQGIRERTLEQLFGRDRAVRAAGEQRPYRVQQAVEPVDFFLERTERLGLVRASLEECAHVTPERRHMPDQIGRGAHAVAGTEAWIGRRRIAQRLLRAVGDGAEHVAEEFSIAIHVHSGSNLF